MLSSTHVMGPVTISMEWKSGPECFLNSATDLALSTKALVRTTSTEVCLNNRGLEVILLEGNTCFYLKSLSWQNTLLLLNALLLLLLLLIITPRAGYIQKGGNELDSIMCPLPKLDPVSLSGGSRKAERKGKWAWFLQVRGIVSG